MKYTFEHTEIKDCNDCPAIDGEYGTCQLMQDKECDDDSVPEWCPLESEKQTQIKDLQKQLNGNIEDATHSMNQTGQLSQGSAIKIIDSLNILAEMIVCLSEKDKKVSESDG